MYIDLGPGRSKAACVFEDTNTLAYYAKVNKRKTNTIFYSSRPYMD